jgi:hypothetical protein
MPGDHENLSLATAENVADGLAFAPRFQGREGIHNAEALMSAIVAKRVAAHLGRSGFVVMKKTPIGGHLIAAMMRRESNQRVDSQNDR